MTEKHLISDTYKRLREEAEKIIEAQRAGEFETDETGMLRLVHELEIQQMQLELQNRELLQAAKDLEFSRNEFFELYHSAPVAIVTVNPKGTIERINDAAARLLGRPGHLLIGRSFSSLIEPEDQQVYFSHMRTLAQHGTVKWCELRMTDQQNRIIHVAFTAASEKESSGNHRSWRFGLIDISDRVRAEDALRRTSRQLEERNRQLARLAAELTLAEQTERRRLADMMHDHLQQLLAGARLNLDIVRSSGTDQSPALQNAFDLITQALETSRTLSGELSPPVLYTHGLCDAFKWLARWMEKTHRLKVDLQIDPRCDPLQEELKVLLFQSVRELLFNVVKHAGTTDAKIDLQRRENRIVLKVMDAGSGFEPQEHLEQNRQSYGLFNIRERLLLLGGDFEIQSRPAAGTTVSLMAPLRTPAFELPPPGTVAEITLQPPEGDRIGPKSDLLHDKTRVMLVDDHAVMRQGLNAMLARHDDIEIVCEAEDGRTAIELARETDPDVILMDLSMPVLDGISATRSINSDRPDIRIIILSMHEAADQAEAAREAGAVAFLSKSGSSEAIVSAIREHGAGRG